MYLEACETGRNDNGRKHVSGISTEKADMFLLGKEEEPIVFRFPRGLAAPRSTPPSYCLASYNSQKNRKKTTGVLPPSLVSWPHGHLSRMFTAASRRTEKGEQSRWPSPSRWTSAMWNIHQGTPLHNKKGWTNGSHSADSFQPLFRVKEARHKGTPSLLPPV